MSSSFHIDERQLKHQFSCHLSALTSSPQASTPWDSMILSISEYKMREKVERLFQGDMETDDCSELHGITLFCNLLVWL